MARRSELEPLRGRAAILLSGLFTTLVLSWGLRAGVGVHDSGELAAAAYHLGIAHPAGSPLWVMLAKGISLLPLAGEPALRMGLLSALAGGLTTVVIAALLSTLNTPTRLAVPLAVAVPLLPRPLWAGTMVEVYGLELALAALMVATVLWTNQRSVNPRSVALPGLVGGLLLSVHHSLAPGVLTALAFLVLTRRRRLSALGAGTAGLALGLTPYLELPLRALRRPAALWADTSTLHGLWHHLSSAQYRPGIPEAPRWPRLAEALGAAGGPVPWLLVPLAVLGGILLWRRSRPAALTLVALLVADFGAVVWFQSMPLDSECYLVVSAGLLGLAAAIGMANVVARRRRLTFLAVPVPVLLLAAGLPWFGRGPEPARWTTARRLAAAPPGALVWLRGDSVAFPAHYHQLVEGWRPDLTLVHPGGYVGADWLSQDPGGRVRARSTPTSRQARAWSLSSRALAAGRCVLHQDRVAFGQRLEPMGTLWTLSQPSAVVGPATVSPLPGETSWHLHPDPTVRGLAEMDHLPLAFTAAARDDPAGARHEASLAALSGPNLATVHRAVGQGWLDLGLLPEARLELERAVGLDPTAPEAWLALGVTRARLGDLPAAIQAWQKALELRPGWSPAMENIQRARGILATPRRPRHSPGT